jgi:leucyl aminopeptidase (aminopeptidase T)
VSAVRTGATMPGVMLARLLGGDVEATARRSRAVAELLTRSRRARITCPLGTDLQVELGARAGIADDGDLRARGAFGNLPCGEAYIARPAAWWSARSPRSAFRSSCSCATAA